LINEKRSSTEFHDKVENRSLHIAVIGLGHIGIPTGLVFAHAGFAVTGVDTNPTIVGRLNDGHLHIREPGLYDYYVQALQSGRFRASTDVPLADVYIVTTPTPVTAEKKADLRHVKSAIENLALRLRKGNMVIVESTVPPRTCETLVGLTIFERTGLKHGCDYDLVHCPERVMPGKVLTEIVENKRIVGGTTPEATARAAQLYLTWVSGEILRTDATTAELCKLMENAFRDVNIALANEFSQICRQLGVDVQEAIHLANQHPRVTIHQPGIGVGGNCVPVVSWFLVEIAPQYSRLVQTARIVNDHMPIVAADHIQSELESKGLKPSHTTIGIIGLTYKPDVDEFSNSPAITVALELQRRGYKVNVWDPYLDDEAELRGLNIQDLETIRHSDYVIELVHHRSSTQRRPTNQRQCGFTPTRERQSTF
jgi:UDP-N-acetyl-D-mannosaminuronic acid dehydrogenase